MDRQDKGALRRDDQLRQLSNILRNASISCVIQNSCQDGSHSLWGKSGVEHGGSGGIQQSGIGRFQEQQTEDGGLIVQIGLGGCGLHFGRHGIGGFGLHSGVQGREIQISGPGLHCWSGKHEVPAGSHCASQLQEQLMQFGLLQVHMRNPPFSYYEISV